MRASFLVITGIALGVLSGCSKGPYATTALRDGTVLVVNTYTGSVERIADGAMEDLHERKPDSSASYRPALTPFVIPTQPFRLTGRARYLSDSMAVIIQLLPSAKPKTVADWTQWRSHLTECRSTGKLVLEFTDRDGFTLVSETVSLNDMNRLVDSNDELAGVEAQVSVSVGSDLYTQISGWDVRWAGFPDVTAPSGGNSPSAAPQ